MTTLNHENLPEAGDHSSCPTCEGNLNIALAGGGPWGSVVIIYCDKCNIITSRSEESCE